jgi:zinc and cadmium transporter
VPLLVIAVGLSLLGSLGGLLVASSFLLFAHRVRTQLLPWLISYAVGALLGVALLALLPEALESLDPGELFATLLAGILLFFMLEKLVIFRHSHEHGDTQHGVAASLVLIGDAFHNFVDGATICTAVLTSVPLGIKTAVAVAAHEIPQEVGDVAILLSAGYSRGQALLLNIISGTAGLLGALVAYGAVGVLPGIRPYILALSAASLLYIAMSDLIPGLHGKSEGSALRQVALIAAGIGTVVLFERIVG